MIKKDSTTSIRKHANKVYKKTVGTAIKQDLKLKSFARTPPNFLSMNMKEKRLKRKKNTKKIVKKIFSILAFKFMATIKPRLDYAIWSVLEKKKCNFQSKYWFA